jgi:dipeptidase
MLYTINKPLILVHDTEDNGTWFEVREEAERNTDTQLVSKEIAVELLEALKSSRRNVENLGDLFNNKSGYINECLAKYDKAITNAEK